MKRNNLIDLKQWFKIDQNPARNGRYLLMVGHRRASGFPTSITVIDKDWSKAHGWDLPDGVWPIQWKYITAEDKKKYFRNYNEYTEWIENK